MTPFDLHSRQPQQPRVMGMAALDGNVAAPQRYNGGHRLRQPPKHEPEEEEGRGTSDNISNTALHRFRHPRRSSDARDDSYKEVVEATPTLFFPPGNRRSRSTPFIDLLNGENDHNTERLWGTYKEVFYQTYPSCSCPKSILHMAMKMTSHSNLHKLCPDR
ncbi:unnamed protein product [Lactuca saligna]|uniref:Uncharacterized protein n=1 Tax=Lactuca saligna TaxID=75948 RepID=A0AA36DWL8_LACSI|nr:unnamed protein product [Lactuca saligna]